MAMINNSYKMEISEIEQPHRYDWVVNCNGNPQCGWQSHVFHANGPVKEAGAIDTAIFHLMAKHGFTQEQAQKAITLKTLGVATE